MGLKHPKQKLTHELPRGKTFKKLSKDVLKSREPFSLYRNHFSLPFLCLSFVQVLVDLSSKNERGLYQARVRALVGGQPLTFYSLVGLENESFYRSVPRVIALALEALKT